MGTLFLWVLLLVGLCVRSSLAFPPTHPHRQHALHQMPQLGQSQSFGHSMHSEHKSRGGEREAVHTVGVTCHPDSLEITIKADMFGVGAPVDNDELHLGVEDNDNCRATASSSHEYRIIVGLTDCGARHWMTKDSLVYTNLLIYSPVPSPYGLVRMDEAVVPIECHYKRRYGLSSSSLTPAWIPFASTQAALDTLKFDLTIMTNDWLYKRSSSVFFLGEPISIQASVRVGHHVGLRVFMSNCVATLNPDINSVPRYAFIKNGCLTDSQVTGSRSHFLARTQDHKLRLVIDAFRFHSERTGQLYITCQLNAAPLNYAEAPNKACSFASKRWLSADGNDYSCRYCPSQAGQTPSKAGPRGFGRPSEPEASWRSGLNTNNVWEQEARVGPVMVLPGESKTGPQPVEELHPVLHKMGRPVQYGSHWRSGINARADLEKGMFPLSTPDLLDEKDEHQGENYLSENEILPTSPSTTDPLEGGYENGQDLNYLENSLFTGLSTPDVVDENDDKSETDLKDLEEGLVSDPQPEPEEENDDLSLTTELAGDTVGATPDEAGPDVPQRAEVEELDNDTTGDLGDDIPTTTVELDVTSTLNVTTTEPNLSGTNDPKR